tara:strand:+ start:77 stop:673 length:597 start_codon:yes stop_codon:yes gene_type:complete
MADVKVSIDEFTAFPTMIYKFKSDLGEDRHSNMSAYIKAKNTMQTEDDLYKLSSFGALLETVHNTTNDILKKLEYQYDKLEMTSMWGNHMTPGMSHPPHTHSNNVWSGVYYVESSEGSAPIQFFDPRPQANTLHPKNKPNWKNSSMLQFDAEVGTGLIFPSWLQHWVPPTQSERTSVSWNMILRGDYGSHQDYQHANI